MSETPRKHHKAIMPPAERMGHAAAGAVVGGVIAGPVGAIAGAAVAALVEKGVPDKTKQAADGDKTPIAGEADQPPGPTTPNPPKPLGF